MAPPKLDPWSSPSEWQTVYRLLYSPDITSQKRGLTYVRMWATRGPRIPLAVESTAELVQATHVSVNDKAAAVPARSLAIIRFVNGHVDKAQGGAYARSVANVAAKLGIPDWIIDIRHNATHKSLPDIDTLSLATTQVLQWLENSYWTPQNSCIESANSEVPHLLSEYVSVQRELDVMLKEGKKVNKTKITLVVEKISSLAYFELSVLPCHLYYRMVMDNILKFDFWKHLLTQLHKTRPSVVAHFIYIVCQQMLENFQYRDANMSLIDHLIDGNLFSEPCQELHALYLDRIMKCKNDASSRRLCCKILKCCGDRVSGKQATLANLFSIMETKTDDSIDVDEDYINKQISDIRRVLQHMEEKAVQVDDSSRFIKCDGPLWERVPLGCIPSNITLSLEETTGEELSCTTEFEELQDTFLTRDSGIIGEEKRNLPMMNRNCFVDVKNLKELRDSIHIWDD